MEAGKAGPSQHLAAMMPCVADELRTRYSVSLGDWTRLTGRADGTACSGHRRPHDSSFPPRRRFAERMISRACLESRQKSFHFDLFLFQKRKQMWVSSYTGVCLPVFPCISLCSFHPLLWENDSARGPTGTPLLTDPKPSWHLTNADRQLDLGLFAPKLCLVGTQLPGLSLPPLDHRLELGVLYSVTL